MRGMIVLLITLSHLIAPLQAQSQSGIVTFTVDNITRDFFDNRFPEFVERDLVGTLYAQTTPIGSDAWQMNWDNLRSMQAAGWEIGAHSYSHEYRLSQVEASVLHLELGAPAARIFREVGVYPTTFASPFGDYDADMMETVRLYYDAHFAAWGNRGFNVIAETDRYEIYREEITEQQGASYYCDKMQEAADRGEWLVFMLHGITDGEPGEYSISHQLFVEVLDCAAALKAVGDIDVLTAVDVLPFLP